jgi:hypothetical protein
LAELSKKTDIIYLQTTLNLVTTFPIFGILSVPPQIWVNLYCEEEEKLVHWQ